MRDYRTRGSCRLCGRPLYSILLLVTAVILALVLRRPFAANMGHVVLDKVLWQQGLSASRRQDAICLAAHLYAAAEPSDPTSAPTEITQSEPNYVGSLVMADTCRKAGRFGETAHWLRIASECHSSAIADRAMALPAAVTGTPHGDIIVQWYSAGWHFRSDSQVALTSVDEATGWLCLSYDNDLAQRDKVIYEWRGPIDLPYWSTAALTVRAEQGTFVTIETACSRELVRHVSYYRGSGASTRFEFPLCHGDLCYIYVSLSEPSLGAEDVQEERYAACISPISLRLDEAYR